MCSSTCRRCTRDLIDVSIEHMPFLVYFMFMWFLDVFGDAITSRTERDCRHALSIHKTRIRARHTGKLHIAGATRLQGFIVPTSRLVLQTRLVSASSLAERNPNAPRLDTRSHTGVKN